MPSETLLRNKRAFTSAMSIWRSTPPVNASRAPATSCRSTPRSSAKWLRVPAGTHTNAIPCAAAAAATTASDPSPPAIPSASAPAAAASPASAARSWPGARMTVSIPLSRARPASPARSAVPSPDLGLTNNTGRRGGSAGRQPEVAPTGARGRFTWGSFGFDAQVGHGTGRQRQPVAHQPVAQYGKDRRRPGSQREREAPRGKDQGESGAHDHQVYA